MMSNFLPIVFRRWLYLLISVVVALGICIGSPQQTLAISWLDFLIQGVQIFQLSNIYNPE